MLAIWLASNERPVSWHMFRFVVTFTNNARSRATPTKPGTKRSLIWLAASIRHPPWTTVPRIRRGRTPEGSNGAAENPGGDLTGSPQDALLSAGGIWLGRHR